MSEECTPLIRLHEQTFAVQPNAVRVLVFFFYNLSECHKIRGASRRLSRAGREENASKRLV